MPARPNWIRELTPDSLVLRLDIDVYSLEVIFRVCYAFTGQCYVYLARSEDSRSLDVHFSSKGEALDLEQIAGEFANELIDQRLRLDIARATQPIRELIVAQAFVEADLLDRADREASYDEDPRGIAS